MENGGKQIQWFPGHMAKTRRMIKENLRLVDAVTEIIDARIPISSRNPEIDNIVGGKPRIILLNKCDIADAGATAKWVNYFEKRGAAALPIDCRSGKGAGNYLPMVRRILSEKIAANESRGMGGKALRVMVVGIPNVGKSSFINRMAGSGRAKAEDRPGVTRGSQWYAIGKGLLLLDTPGVLWPKFDDPVVGRNLAFTGAVKDNILDTVELSYNLLKYLLEHYPDEVARRYKVEPKLYDDTYDIFCDIGRKRGMLISGGEVNEERLAAMLLDEFRGGKIGRITLEMPNTIQD